MSETDLITIPIFPLPNYVLFPGVTAPLHLFEPRYREMMEYVLEEDGLIAMAHLKPGWDENYLGTPPVYRTVTVGEVIHCERQEDGRFNILLRGVSRGRIRSEQLRGMHRVAEVQFLTDAPLTDEDREVINSDTTILSAYTSMLSQLPDEARVLFEPAESDMPIETAIDGLAFALTDDYYTKQSVLDEGNVARRIRMVHQMIAMAMRPESEA